MADTDISEEEILDNEDGENADGAKPKKSGRRKLILFGLIGLLVVGATGGGAFLFLGGKKTNLAEEGEPPVIETPVELTYIDVEPIFIQVETGNGELQNVVVALALEVELGNSDAARVKNEMPRLYEAYLRTLTERPLPGADNGDVEVTHIKNRIRAENLRLLGPGVVYDVVLNNMWITE
ncbi:MAG: hypothetical protein OER92_00655 [Alphaproteobacteria bacterium]|nr:hypothetical protein [Alphaproteobacteria bacterium]